MADTPEEEQRKIDQAVALATVANDVGWMRKSMEEQGKSLERIEQAVSEFPKQYATKEELAVVDKKADEARKFVWKASGALALAVVLIGVLSSIHGGIHIP